MLKLEMAKSLITYGSSKGRPSTDINLDDVKYLITLGFTKSQIAELLGISRKTLYNKIGSCDSKNFSNYSDMTETQLDDIVRRVKLQHPNNGEVTVAGHLLKMGYRVQRSKPRSSIHRVDPVGTAERRRLL